MHQRAGGRPGFGTHVARALVAAAALASADAAGAADFGVALEGGWFGMNASQSAEAVFDGSSGGGVFGGAVRYGFGERWFVAVGARRFSKDGERVFLADAASEPFPLGHPLSIRILPVYALFGFRPLRDAFVSPYVAAGPGLTSYREESTVAEITESDSQTKASGHLALGAEVGRGRLRFGAELMYTAAPDAIGVAGVSRVYDEKDIGGFSAVGRVLLVF